MDFGGKGMWERHLPHRCSASKQATSICLVPHPLNTEITSGLTYNPDGSEMEETNSYEKMGSNSQIQGKEQTICLATNITSIF